MLVAAGAVSTTVAVLGFDGGSAAKPAPSDSDLASLQGRLLARERELAAAPIDPTDGPLDAREVVRRASFGADPTCVLPLDGDSGPGTLVLCRGISELLVLDEEFRVRDRVPTLPSPASFVRLAPDRLAVGSEYTPSIEIFAIEEGRLRSLDTLSVAGVTAASSLELESGAEPSLGPVSEAESSLEPASEAGSSLERASNTEFSLDRASEAKSSRERASDGACSPALAPGDARLWVADAWGDHVVALDLSWIDPEARTQLRASASRVATTGRHPLAVRSAGGYLVRNDLLDHVVTVCRPGPDSSEVRIEHDGPIWSLAATTAGETLWLALGGIEDRPLDRRSGEFGHVDSYLFLVRVPRQPGTPPERVAEINLSEHGVLTPKRLRWAGSRVGGLSEARARSETSVERRPVDVGAPAGHARALEVSGFGGDRLLRVGIDLGDDASDRILSIETWDAPPGITDFFPGRHGWVGCSPLLDAVVVIPYDGGETRRGTRYPIESPEAAERSRDAWLGEVLFYTGSMAPENETAGLHSRFSCESCHFEGGIDGRTHYTGREHVHATTKPVRGLLRNTPLFSRAGDRTLTSMVLAEFRAVQQSGPEETAWIHLDPAEHSWLREIGRVEPVSPEAQRFALLEFLSEFPHRPQPRRLALGGTSLPAEAREGVAVFADRCAHCHRPVSTTRDDSPRATVPIESWERWLSAPTADLIWGGADLMRTGVTPYVSRSGARVPSLRRVQWKRPYFTNGSSRDLRDVLDRFRYRGLEAWHDADAAYEVFGRNPSDGVPASLRESETRALLALLPYM